MADTPILSNPSTEMMKAGKVALGMNVRLARSCDIARIAKSCGHDFIFIDGQHAIFSVETIAHIAHTALGCGITPLARVKERRRPGRASAARAGPQEARVCPSVAPPFGTPSLAFGTPSLASGR
jgi:2-keto-3-deoxy-L-rhamnonate aldolase RhmA